MNDMVGKVVTNIIVILLFSGLYYVFASKNLFPDYVQFIKIYYPLGIIIISLIVFSLNKWFLKSNSMFTVIFVLLGITFLILSSSVISSRFKSILQDYYAHTHTSNLLGMNNYKHTKGNYISVYQALNKKGLQVHTLAAGNDSSFAQNSPKSDNRDNYKEVIYLVNEDHYIIYNWSNHTIEKIAAVDAVVDQCIKFLSMNQTEIHKESITQTIIRPEKITLLLAEGDFHFLSLYPKNQEILFKLSAPTSP